MGWAVRRRRRFPRAVRFPVACTSTSCSRAVPHTPLALLHSATPATRSRVVAAEPNAQRTATPGSLGFKLGCSIDPGGAHKVNQDDMFLWQDPTGDTLVIGILDGHGRDLGQLASATAKASMLATIGADGACAAMRADMTAFFHSLFDTTHEAVRQAFRDHHAKIGWEVKDEAATGGSAGAPAYLLKRRVGSNGRWDCVHGGSTATVAIIIDGRW